MLFVVALGFFLRLGVPIGLTILFAWWLKHLDSQWQRESLVRPAAKAAPCWEVRGCTPEQREICPAYLEGQPPCWEVFRGADGDLPPACLTCSVYGANPVIAVAGLTERE